MIYSLAYGLEKIRLPIIVVKIKNKNLCFIIDTGSNCNLIDCRVAECFKDIVTHAGDYYVSGIDGNRQKVNVVILPFNFEGQIFSPKFCKKPLLETFKDIEKDNGIQIHGILGIPFLVANHWVIDFKNYKIWDYDTMFAHKQADGQSGK